MQFHIFLPPVVTGNYISYQIFVLKNQKFQVYHTISLVSLAGHSLLCILLGLLTALSYSDLVKSWRGECGGIGIGPYCMYSLPYMYVCACTRRPCQVIVSACSPLYMMSGYVTKAWDEGYYIRY